MATMTTNRADRNFVMRTLVPRLLRELQSFEAEADALLSSPAYSGITVLCTGQPYTSTDPVNLASGHPIDVDLTYLNGVLTLTLNDATAQTSFTTSLSLDIPGTVGGNTAYVGFTGADGGTSSKQWVNGFTYLGLVGLGIQPAANQSVTVSWPAAAGGYVLQQSAAVSPTSWTNVTTLPVNAGQVDQVTLPAPGKATYRLSNTP